ncbi:hypothetical protein STRAU_1695 [Streptomyces aurantiacus JA 4570]|uniref:Uncharacterized protein n=1 Tax=Streptomyces aurantiacus JA 4570 TaxID=1286094 RepID=S3ZQX9_9ACTN|nr:hypothetical protein STRAU_1695 [Streptomyces aurantiacus JA 4570]
MRRLIADDALRGEGPGAGDLNGAQQLIGVSASLSPPTTLGAPAIGPAGIPAPATPVHGCDRTANTPGDASTQR